ncbi:MAG: BrnT family toxin [Bacteroidetes bacterium]|nr:BrnT family toxin [Bacteroidota bacterium]
MTIKISNCEGFEWDEGNIEKNWLKHHVSKNECEEVFFNHPLLATGDPKHSKSEKRYYILGQTDSGRLLFIAFTIRNGKIRVISARDMSRKEKRKYYEEIEDHSKI